MITDEKVLGTAHVAFGDNASPSYGGDNRAAIHVDGVMADATIEADGAVVMVKRFLIAGRSGFYVAVTREGEVGAGDEIKILARDPNAVPVSAISKLYLAKSFSDEHVALAKRTLKLSNLPDSWKDYFRERLQEMNA